eukprot:TRINITY_DN1485_c0_g1_i1.p1 TRINITY_DN1485_c0_g1~~TRINITY_DN1485_c0_g1_i1.p1  ORF type:complete len:414 (-),score=58.22 TRINITY_DN1485_c0_g1_i1:75-1316(-)
MRSGKTTFMNRFVGFPLFEYDITAMNCLVRYAVNSCYYQVQNGEETEISYSEFNQLLYLDIEDPPEINELRKTIEYLILEGPYENYKNLSMELFDTPPLDCRFKLPNDKLIIESCDTIVLISTEEKTMHSRYNKEIFQNYPNCFTIVNKCDHIEETANPALAWNKLKTKTRQALKDPEFDRFVSLKYMTVPEWDAMLDGINVFLRDASASRLNAISDDLHQLTMDLQISEIIHTTRPILRFLNTIYDIANRSNFKNAYIYSNALLYFCSSIGLPLINQIMEGRYANEISPIYGGAILSIFQNYIAMLICFQIAYSRGYDLNTMTVRFAILEICSGSEDLEYLSNILLSNYQPIEYSNSRAVIVHRNRNTNMKWMINILSNISMNAILGSYHGTFIKILFENSKIYEIMNQVFA